FSSAFTSAFSSVVSKLRCPVFLASEMSGFGFTNSNIYPAVGAVGMWALGLWYDSATRSAACALESDAL
ncbi:MAG TPA: hypothetical protein VFZ22_09045, partial [Pyrinomonadaceae bacterium]|nr:hypothetical protein [Pyrinomonadaceae bacterium]